MGRRQIHYERAFTAMLADRGVPYVAVDEARRAVLPGAHGPLSLPSATDDASDSGPRKTLKAFDYVLYGTPNLLVELKGRRLPAGSTRLENWVTDDDVDSLRRWRAMFGEGYTACFVFVYECGGMPLPLAQQEPGHRGPSMEDAWTFRDRWYALRAIDVEAYAAHMRVRSARWRTVCLARADFERVSGPLMSGTGAAGALGREALRTGV